MQSEFRRSRRRDPVPTEQPKEPLINQSTPAVDDKENKDSSNLRRQEQDSQMVMRLRRDAAKQLKDLASEHEQELKSLQEKYEEEIKLLSASFQKQLNEKEDYIKMLEQMIEGEAGELINSTDHSNNCRGGQPTFGGGQVAEVSRERHSSMASIVSPEQQGKETQLSNRLYLGPQQEPVVLDRQIVKSLAKPKSKSLFLAQKVSKHRITPMSKPSYPQYNPD